MYEYFGSWFLTLLTLKRLLFFDTDPSNSNLVVHVKVGKLAIAKPFHTTKTYEMV